MEMWRLYTQLVKRLMDSQRLLQLQANVLRLFADGCSFYTLVDVIE